MMPISLFEGFGILSAMFAIQDPPGDTDAHIGGTDAHIGGTNAHIGGTDAHIGGTDAHIGGTDAHTGAHLLLQRNLPH